MAEPIEGGDEIALDISCTSSPTEMWGGTGTTKSDKLWSELVIHGQWYNVSGPWHVSIKRHRAGGTDTLSYTTNDLSAPPNAGPGSHREALTTRTVADFNDLSWTSPTGDLFTAKIWKPGA